MNYVQHSLIGIGSAGAGLWLGTRAGLDLPDAATMVIAAGLIGVGSIATDIDHPQAYVSHRLPLKVLARLFPPLILIIGLVVGLSMASGHSVEGGLYRLWIEIPLVRWMLAGIGFALGLMLVARLVSTAVKHRGPLHSIIFSVGVTLVAVGLAVWANQSWGAWWLGACLGWGWTWHVLADSLTARGTPLWWPITNKRVRFFGLPYS